LDYRSVRHALAAHEEGNADDALIADDGDLGGRPALQDVKQGYDGRDREIDIGEGASGFVYGLPEREIDQLEAGEAGDCNSASGNAASRWFW
jgi:hypothetical protein